MLQFVLLCYLSANVQMKNILNPENREGNCKILLVLVDG
jgi:hypothetical protein